MGLDHKAMARMILKSKMPQPMEEVESLDELDAFDSLDELEDIYEPMDMREDETKPDILARVMSQRKFK